ncbi:MAG TPA: hypothetical protein VFD46_11410 [Chryseolinea sp.]|nr:hypothetical protein [Chryseolinea sp.]
MRSGSYHLQLKRSKIYANTIEVVIFDGNEVFTVKGVDFSLHDQNGVKIASNLEVLFPFWHDEWIEL